MENPTKMDDEQGYPYFGKPPYTWMVYTIPIIYGVFQEWGAVAQELDGLFHGKPNDEMIYFMEETTINRWFYNGTPHNLGNLQM